MKKIIVSHKSGRTCAAVLVDKEFEKFYSAHENNPQLVGNIYKGRVKNFLAGMRAAFVDIGRDKNIFLQTNSLQKFSVGQDILIQIEKDAVGTKAESATLNISLAGRFLIFLPTFGYIGVSYKIRGEERERLYKLARKICPEEASLIVRTAAAGCDENILLEDLTRLKILWEKILERFNKRKSPALLYSDNDLVEKIIREEFTADAEIIVDNLKIYRRLAEFPNVNFYDGSAQIFESFGLTEEISNLNKRELLLPSGGQIVIDKTEALTAIDVNTCKFIGHDDFDETILKTNLEAAELILKQLKLRDAGGIIIVDFIDMSKNAHKKTLMNFLRERAKLDRNKTKIIDMTPLGLVEITRHKSL